MSEQHNHAESNPSLPPAGGPQRQPGASGWGPLLPTLLSAAGGLAALWLLENQTHAVSRSAKAARGTADDLWHDAQGWADGGWPVEPDPSTHNLDPSSVAGAITPRTRALRRTS